MATAPYPPSTVITDIDYNWSTFKRKASGSDNFPITWGQDNNQYTSWGDGDGFEGSERTPLGVARVEGPHATFDGDDLWEASEENGWGGKSYGIIDVEGTLYMWVSPGSLEDNWNYVRLAWSTDGGNTWDMDLDKRFVEESDGVGLPTFLQYGRGNDGAPDDYVYSYFIGITDPYHLIVQKPGDFYIARVHKDDMLDDTAYEWYSNGSWSSNINNKTSVFHDPDGVCRVSVSYNPGLDRYFLMTEHDEARRGRLGIFDSPTPWGPWTTVYYQEGGQWEDRGTVFYWNFANKWLSTDGKDFVMVYSGSGDADAWQSVEGSFTVSTGGNNAPNTPSSVTATALGQTSIEITWTDNGDPDGDDVQFYVREVDDSNINSDWLAFGTTTWTATGLDPGTTYQFEVRARDDGDPPLTSNWVQSNEETTDPSSNNPPYDPSDVVAVAQGQTVISITWTDNGDPDGDDVRFYVREVNDYGINSGWLATGDTSWDATNLDPGTTYQFEVRGQDDGEPGLYSNWVQSNEETTDPAVNNPPHDPTNIYATVQGPTSITITWTDNGDPDGDDIQYYVREINDTGINSGWLDVGVDQWTAIGLQPETAYTFEVRGQDDGDPPLASNWVESNTVTTQASENNPPYDPSDVTATPMGQSAIRITWTDNGDPDGDDVRYFVREVNDHTIRSMWLEFGETSWDATGLEPGTTYQFEVRGQDNGDPDELYSNWVESNEATTESTGNNPPNDPTDVLATALGTTSIRIDWTDNGDPDGDGVRYLVREVEQPFEFNSGWLPAGTTNWEAAGLEPGTTYQFEVQGRDDGDPIQYSRWVMSNEEATDESSNDPPGAVDGVYGRPIVPGTTQMLVVWNPAEDVDGPSPIEYQVHNITLDTYSDWIGVTRFIDEKLDPGAEYEYEVRARDGAQAEGEYGDASPGMSMLTYPHQGFGAGTDGGLYGEQFVVTSLADSGAGTLREALSESDRYITFALGGTITLDERIRVDVDHITVDGSNTPEPGITITCPTGDAIVLDKTGTGIAHDIVLRNLRIENSLGVNLAVDGQEGTLGSTLIVIDHCSIRGAGDTNLSIMNSANEVAVQWCILGGSSENLRVAQSAGDVTFHHNIYTQAERNSPSVDGNDNGVVDVVNNIIHAWGTVGSHWYSDQSITQGNLIANLYVPADTSEAAGAVTIEGGAAVYSVGNRVPAGANANGTATERFEAPAVYEQVAAQAAVLVLSEAGAFPRDATDTAFLEQLESDINSGSHTDVLAPAPVSDLEIVEVGAVWVRLGWHATGDDGLSGRASGYDLRYSTTPIDESNFEDASQVLDLDPPEDPGSEEDETVTGLLPETIYYFAIVVEDEQGNRSSVSPHVSAETLVDDSPLDPPEEAPGARFQDDVIVVSWPESNDLRVVGYHVYRTREGDSEIRLTDTPTTETSYSDSDVTGGQAYFYRITGIDAGARESDHSASTWIRASIGLPPALTIDRVYPNPVKSNAVFRFQIPEFGPGHPGGMRVTIDLFNVAGRRVSRVVDDYFLPGVREVSWSLASAEVPLSSGLYVGMLKAGGHKALTRIAIVR